MGGARNRRWWGIVEEGVACYVHAWNAAEVAKTHARRILCLVVFLCRRPTLMDGVVLARLSFGLPWFIVFVFCFVFVHLAEASQFRPLSS